MSDDPYLLASPEAVREHYGYPLKLVTRKVLTAVDRHCQRFIAASPCIIVSTANAAGQCNSSPRGDAPGFVRIVDRTTLLIPDRKGNNRVDALMDIAENPHIGILFLVPGMTETLRVNGTAAITVAPDILDTLGTRDKPAKAAIRVTVEEAFFHCGRALIRSNLWDPARHVPKEHFEPMGKILSEHANLDYDPQLEEAIAEQYRDHLY